MRGIGEMLEFAIGVNVQLCPKPREISKVAMEDLAIFINLSRHVWLVLRTRCTSSAGLRPCHAQC